MLRRRLARPVLGLVAPRQPTGQIGVLARGPRGPRDPGLTACPAGRISPAARPAGARHTAWMPRSRCSYSMGEASTPYPHGTARSGNAPGATPAAGPPPQPRVTRPAGQPERATWRGRNPRRKRSLGSLSASTRNRVTGALAQTSRVATRRSMIRDWRLARVGRPRPAWALCRNAPSRTRAISSGPQ